MRKLFKYKYLLLVILVLVILLPEQVAANPDSDTIAISGTFGFDGYYKTRTPTPISLTINNSGELLDGWVQADLRTWVPPAFYTHPILVAPGGTREVELGCYGAWESSPLDVPVRILSKAGVQLEEIIFQSKRIGFADSLLLHIGEPSDSPGNLFNGINPGFVSMIQRAQFPASGFVSYSPRIFPVVIVEEDIPGNPILMDGVSTVACSLSTWLALQEESRDVIEEWVLQGGNILIYYREGFDPVDGWSDELLLPVEPSGATVTISGTELLELCDRSIDWDSVYRSYPDVLSTGMDREISGAAVNAPWIEEDPYPPVSDESTLNTGGYEATEGYDVPDSISMVSVRPVDPADIVIHEDSGMPVLVTKVTGSGRAGFISFDPFEGSPGASDKITYLIAQYGLFDPQSQTRELAAASVNDFRTLTEQRIQGYFGQGTVSSEGGFLKWLELLGPALVYLLVLPVLVFLARGNGRLVLVLFIFWSILFTGYTFIRKTRPVNVKSNINEAALFWCSATSPDRDEASSCYQYSCYTYNSNSSAPQSLTWLHEGGILDEFVTMYAWPYGYITIESRNGETHLPDLTLSRTAFGTGEEGSRTFVFKRPVPEVRASGVLSVGPDEARLQIQGDLLFPANSGRLMVSSNKLWVGVALGRVEEEFNIDLELETGTEIIRRDGLFEGIEDGMASTGQSGQGSSSMEADETGYILNRFREIVSSMPVNRDQSNTVSIQAERPRRAYVLFMAAGSATDINIERGDLELNGITIFVVTVPIEYTD